MTGTRKLPTVADLRAQKGKRQLTMLRYFDLDEAQAAEQAGIDIASVPSELLFDSRYRDVAPTVFSMTGRTHLEAGTADDYLRWSGDAVNRGADAIYCSGSLQTVELLAREHIPIVGHVGLVPASKTIPKGKCLLGFHQKRRSTMLKRTILGATIAFALSTASSFAQDAKTLFWVSHGAPADPVWTYFLEGAEQWATDTGNKVNTSFHSGDVPSHQEAIRAAIAAGADGICSTSPDPGSMTEVVKEARAAGIPIVNFNSSDDAPNWNGYVGIDLLNVGVSWAQYLVDNGHVKKGDFVWMPVEVPGASYGVEEEKGIASVFEPLDITWEVTDATLDQAEIITRMTDYITANRDRISAMIGLGDLVTGSVKRVWNQTGLKPGDIPVVGWGNSLDTTQEVMDGYVSAAMWQDPQATSYMCLSAALMESSDIPLGFKILTGALYEADTAPIYHKIMGGK